MYADIFNTIARKPYSQSGKNARKFIQTVISQHRILANKSFGFMRLYNNRIANSLEKNLYHALAGNYVQ